LAIAATLAFLEKGVWVNQIHDGPVHWEQPADGASAAAFEGETQTTRRGRA
jgi:hypothetical protein